MPPFNVVCGRVRRAEMMSSELGSAGRAAALAERLYECLLFTNVLYLSADFT